MNFTQEGAADGAVRKVFRHLLWFLVVLYVMSYLDRINIGFAALTMNRDLGLSATKFGLANTFFYITYAAFEIPSNLMLVRFGARKWLSRIMVTWGIAACATMFATSAYSLYGLRALVGLAEAGALPGVLLYLGLWFPKAWRAKANWIFLMSMPLAMIIGAPLSGFMLQLEGWLGLAGWKWLFLIEGLPSIALGVVGYFYLPDRPADAKWLTPEERVALQKALDDEKPVTVHTSPNPWPAIWRELRTKKVLCLAVAWFCMVATINTLGTWSPQIVRELLGGTDRLVLVGLVTAIPPLLTIFTMPIFSASSDRAKERLWHTISLVAVAATGWVTVVVAAHHPVIQMLGLTLASVGIFGAYGIFWAMASPMLSSETQPVGIAVITTSGIFASILSPTIIGFLRDATVSFNAGLWYSATLLVIGMGFIFFAKKSAQTNTFAPVS